MIDEMMPAFDSPGSVSTALIITLLFRDPTTMREAAMRHISRKVAADV
jgi:hypothetical protein